MLGISRSGVISGDARFLSAGFLCQPVSNDTNKPSHARLLVSTVSNFGVTYTLVPVGRGPRGP